VPPRPFTPDAVGRAVYLTPPPLKFDHSAHRAAPCETCHGDLRAVGLATTQHLQPWRPLPALPHQRQRRAATAPDCHLTSAAADQTQFDQGHAGARARWPRDAHGRRLQDHHTQEAQQIGATCGACHDRSECVACHQGVVKPMDFTPATTC